MQTRKQRKTSWALEMLGFFSAASDSGNKRTHKPPKSSVCF